MIQLPSGLILSVLCDNKVNWTFSISPTLYIDNWSIKLLGFILEYHCLRILFCLMASLNDAKQIPPHKNEFRIIVIYYQVFIASTINYAKINSIPLLISDLMVQYFASNKIVDLIRSASSVTIFVAVSNSNDVVFKQTLLTAMNWKD